LGNVALETDTEFDGFYLLSSIKPGDYQLRVKPSYLTSKNLSQLSKHPIKIRGDGTIVRSEDIILSRNIEVILSDASDINSIRVVNLGEYPSLATLKISWMRLRSQFPNLTRLVPVIPLSNITKSKTSNSYPLRLLTKENDAITELCQAMKKENNRCFEEFVTLKQ
jgi:hypothetical protein